MTALHTAYETLDHEAGPGAAGSRVPMKLHPGDHGRIPLLRDRAGPCGNRGYPGSPVLGPGPDPQEWQFSGQPRRRSVSRSFRHWTPGPQSPPVRISPGPSERCSRCGFWSNAARATPPPWSPERWLFYAKADTASVAGRQEIHYTFLGMTDLTGNNKARSEDTSWGSLLALYYPPEE